MMERRRSTRCQGWPLRESSWDSFGEADHGGGAAEVFEGAEEGLAAGAGGRAVVGLAEDEHERGLDLLDMSQR